VKRRDKLLATNLAAIPLAAAAIAVGTLVVVRAVDRGDLSHGTRITIRPESAQAMTLAPDAVKARLADRLANLDVAVRDDAVVVVTSEADANIIDAAVTLVERDPQLEVREVDDDSRWPVALADSVHYEERNRNLGLDIDGGQLVSDRCEVLTKYMTEAIARDPHLALPPERVAMCGRAGQHDLSYALFVLHASPVFRGRDVKIVDTHLDDTTIELVSPVLAFADDHARVALVLNGRIRAFARGEADARTITLRPADWEPLHVDGDAVELHDLIAAGSVPTLRVTERQRLGILPWLTRSAPWLLSTLALACAAFWLSRRR
jgi:hypothetical protein